jgi:predicted nuclease of restriction endonuclease-like (RecB) superfamily
MAKRKPKGALSAVGGKDYEGLLTGVAGLLDHARVATARVINGVMTATYYELGRRIVEFEQGGKERAGYGDELIDRLSADLTKRFGRGFSRSNLFQIRGFYLGWEIVQTPSGLSHIRAKPVAGEKPQTVSVVPATPVTTETFPLPWSHYVRLMTVGNPTARRFYEEEAIKGGWSVRQLDRQISTQFFERLSGSKRQGELLTKAHIPQQGDAIDPALLVRDPYVLEFLDLTDEYGESELEEAIIRNLEGFLVELGRGFTFVARQRKIRIDAQWFKIDLLLFHRRLRCLVVIDLKIGPFTHADAGQMNLYLNYAKENLTEPGENEPVGLILCSEKSDTVVRYAMGGINAKVFASEYLTVLPPEDELRAAVERTRLALAARAGASDNV